LRKWKQVEVRFEAEISIQMFDLVGESNISSLNLHGGCVAPSRNSLALLSRFMCTLSTQCDALRNIDLSFCIGKVMSLRIRLRIIYNYQVCNLIQFEKAFR